MAREMIKQKPTSGYDWLYEDRAENDRYFTDVVYLPEGTPLWSECTDAEKTAWEEAHKVVDEPDKNPS